ncbi:MAG: N-acetylglucosamine-6-phosphate deacetylase [Erysipelotrichaceae bacterium]|nr:N-acetylglucosamine-6-phosphate deacetylase [Erysipelotrichaceae bacterium]
MIRAIHNVSIYPDDKQFIKNGCVLFEDGHILEAGDESLRGRAEQRIDGNGLILLPGFIDVHVHGGYGYDFLEDGLKAVEVFSRQASASGCTSYLASFVSDHQDRLIEVMKQYAADFHFEGAQCLGIHMEGPFLSRKRAAVMKPETLRDPSTEEFQKMIEASGHKIVQMTIAPELPGAMELIEYGTSQGISMMLGHSEADVKTARMAIAKGAVGLTHMYNAMGQHEHRQPGLVTAGLLCDELLCELITDGFHIHPDVLKTTYKLIRDRIAIITDSSLVRGLPDGEYFFSGHRVSKQGIRAVTVDKGTIAGSAVDMRSGISTFRELTGASWNEIVRMASINPAVIARCYSRKGKLHKGYDADMVLIDENVNVMATYVRGEKVY